MPGLKQFKTYLNTRIPHGSFWHNVLIMFTGTALGQLCSLLLSPILTRVYSPEQFGILGVFTAIVSTASVVAALRYEMALPIAQSEKDAADVLGVCGIVLLCSTLLVSLVILIFSVTGSGQTLLGELYPYRWFMPLGMFCITAYQILVSFATRSRSYAIISRTKIYQGCVAPVSQIGMGLGGAGAWGLVIGFVIGQSVGISLLFKRLIVASNALASASLSGMKAMASRYRKFPLFSSWAALIEALGNGYMLMIAIAFMYSHEIVGFLFLIDRVIGRPLLLITTSVLQVYIGDVSQSLSLDPEAVRKRFLSLTKQLFVIVAGWLLLINVLAPFLFPIVFGQRWAAAVPYLHILSIAYLPIMIMHPVVHTLQLIEKQKLSAIWEICRVIILLTVLLINYVRDTEPLYAILTYCMVQAFAQCMLFVLMYRSIQSLKKA